MKRLASYGLAAALAILVTLALADTLASATPGAGVQVDVLGRTTITPFHFHNSLFTMTWKKAEDVLVQRVTIAPGGTTGWHAHAGPSFGIVASGTITAYEGSDKNCTPKTFTAGQGFEDPGGTHLVTNTGSEPAVVYLTMLAIPIGANPHIDMPAPATGCTA